jgi:hypothetical protein
MEAEHLPTRSFTAADVEYVTTNFVALEALCAREGRALAGAEEAIAHEQLPAPTYVLDDGTRWVASDLFALPDAAAAAGVTLRDHFRERYVAACAAEDRSSRDLDEDWAGYIRGGFGRCLYAVTPENIVRKGALLTSLSELLVLARPRAADWQARLRAEVDELDALERPFAPDYDRDPSLERPPTRDLLVGAAHERFPDVFAEQPTAASASR